MPEEWVSRLLAVSPTGSGHKGTAPAPLPAARLRLRSSLGADADPNRRLRLRWVSPAQPKARTCLRLDKLACQLSNSIQGSVKPRC